MASSSADRVKKHRDREKYVAREIAITKAQYGSDPDRLARSERYARAWYDGELGPRWTR